MRWPIISASANSGGLLAVKPRACAVWAATLLERAEFHGENGDTLLSVACADKAICVLEELLFGARRLRAAVSGASATNPAQTKPLWCVGQQLVLSLTPSLRDDGDFAWIGDDHECAPDSRSGKQNEKQRETVQGAQDFKTAQIDEVSSDQVTVNESEVGQTKHTHVVNQKIGLDKSSTGITALNCVDYVSCHWSSWQGEVRVEVARQREDELTVTEENQDLNVTIDKNSQDMPHVDTGISDVHSAPPAGQCHQQRRYQPAEEEMRVGHCMMFQNLQDEAAVAPTTTVQRTAEVMQKGKNTMATNTDLCENPAPEVSSELLEEIVIGSNQTCTDSWKSQPFMSEKGLIWKKAQGKIAGESPAEVAALQYFEAIEDDWLMLGHGVSSEMFLVKESPLVKRAEHWVRCWCNLNSGHHHDCSIYIPAVDDPDYVACGVVFLFNKGCWDWYEPPENMPVGVVHKSLVRNATESLDFWSYAGTYDVTLKHVMRMGTAWPDCATLLSEPLPALEIHPRFTQTIVPLYPPISFRVLNTFIHVADEQDGDLEALAQKCKRAVRTWPCTPCATPREAFKENVVIRMPDFGNETLPTLGSAGHHRGTCKPCAFGRQGCRNGASCRFCHLCVPREKKRGRWNLKRGRRKEELLKELDEYSPDACMMRSPP